MKKLLSFFIIFTFIITPSLAAQKAVKYEARQLQLQSQLKNRYSAFEISFTNQGNDAIRVDHIKCYNKINVVDTSTDTKLKKSTKWALGLCPFTLGLSCLAAMPDINKQNQQVSLILDEQKRFAPVADYFSNNDGLATNNETLLPGEKVRYNLLVPLNEKPQISASFQNLKTYKFINVAEEQ